MRIGVVGCGYIGRSIVGRAQQSDGRFEIAFVYNRRAAALGGAWMRLFILVI